LIFALVAFVAGVLVSWVYHRDTVSILKERVRDLDQERKLFLDQLTMAGFGAPIFGKTPVAVTTPEPQPEAGQSLEERVAEKVALGQSEQRVISSLRRSPGRLAAYLTSKLKREYLNKKSDSPHISPEEAKAQLEALEEIDAIEREVTARPEAGTQ
jgi:hypothetical protein